MPHRGDTPSLQGACSVPWLEDGRTTSDSTGSVTYVHMLRLGRPVIFQVAVSAGAGVAGYVALRMTKLSVLDGVVRCRLITGSIEGMAKGSGLPTSFLSIVLLPLAGNAVEHITAVMVAMKNKMDLALAIAIGSSIQIAIFVLPTCVVFAWSMGNKFSLHLDDLGAPRFDSYIWDLGSIPVT